MEETTIQPTINTAAQRITITVDPAGAQSASTTPETKKELPKEKEETKKILKEKEKIKENEESLIPQVPYYSDPLFYEVANYFGLKQEDYDGAKNKLSDIVEYTIRELGSNKIEDIIPRLREIEDSISSPGWDERRYANFHKYIRLADKKATIAKMMQAYEKKKK